MQKKYPNYATIGKLTRFYFTGRGLHNRHTQFPNKQRKEKESRLPLVPLENGRPLVSLVSRRHVLSARTCPPRTHTPTANCAVGAAFPLSSLSVFSSHGPDRNTSGLEPLSPCFPHTSDPQRVRSHVHHALFLQHFFLLLQLLPLPSSRSAPFWACSTSLRQSGADTPPSFVTVTGGFFLHPAKNLGVIVFSAPNQFVFLMGQPMRIYSSNQ